MSDLISRQQAIRLYCREHCGCEPEECGFTLERDGTEKCSVVRFLKELPSAQPDSSACWGCNCPKMEQKTFSEMVHLHDAERRTDE